MQTLFGCHIPASFLFLRPFGGENVAEPTFQDWFAKQREIFGGFADNSPFVHGTVIDSGSNPLSGLLVSFVPPTKLAHPLAALSTAGQEAVPHSVGYSLGQIHVTVGDFDLQPLSDRPTHHGNPVRQLQEWRMVIDTVRDAVTRAVGTLSEAARLGATMRYTTLLANRSSVIVASEPSEGLYAVRTTVLEAIRKAGVNMRGGWGAHTTVLRFRDNYPAEAPELKALASVMGAADMPSHEFAMRGINVAVLSADGQTFKLASAGTIGL